MPLPTLLGRRRFWVLDGGLATELERRGADLHDPLWSARVLLDRPALIREVHRAYLEAGADLITTASYQATFEGLARRGLSAARAETVFRASVRLAEEARADFLASPASEGRERPLIAASIGPYGAFLHDGSEYRGAYGLTDRALTAFHRDRLLLLTDCGADLIACETIPSRREACVLVDLLERQGRAVGWISFTGRDDVAISDGTPFAECVRAVEGSERVLATGVNCTAPDLAASLLESARGSATKPFVVYPNSGETYDAATGGWGGRPVDDWVARLVPRYVDSGAKVIGGCCRTTPTTVSEIRRRLQEREQG